MAVSEKDPGKDPAEDTDAGKNDDGGDTGRAEHAIPSEDSRRPPRTIDLKAEEVDEEAAKGEANKADEEAGSSKPEKVEPETEKDAGSPSQDAGGPSDEPAQRTTRGEVRGFVTHLAAGLVGGVIGVIGVGIGLDKLPFGALTGETQSKSETLASDALNARLDELETKVSALGEAAQNTSSIPAENLAALEKRIAGAEKGLVAIKDFPDVMTERVTRLEAALKTLGETAAQGGDVAQQAAFDARMSALEQRLGKRVDAVEKSVAETKADTPDSNILTALRKDLDEVKNALAEIRSVPTDSGVRAEVVQRLSDLEKKITGVSTGTTQPGRGSGGGALAIGFAGLTRAIVRGEPYLRELEAVKSMAPAGLDLSPLEAQAAKGAPTHAALQQSFHEHARAARDAGSAEQADNSLVGQLVSRARTIVRIERIDAGTTGGVPAVLSRMAEHLKSGKLNEAITEAEKLPDSARTAMRLWLDQARARLELDKSVKQLSGRLAEILARSGAPQSGN